MNTHTQHSPYAPEQHTASPGALLSRRPVPRLLYPSLIVAAICVTLLSLLGIAGITGHLPSLFAQTGSSAPQQVVASQPCASCGVVTSVRAVTLHGKGSGLGAVAGGVAGALLGNQMGQGNGRTAMTIIGGGAGAYAGNEIEKNSQKSVVWQVRVRMDDGSYRTVTSHTQPDVGVDSKVKVIDGQVVPRPAETAQARQP